MHMKLRTDGSLQNVQLKLNSVLSTQLICIHTIIYVLVPMYVYCVYRVAMRLVCICTYVRTYIHMYVIVDITYIHTTG